MLIDVEFLSQVVVSIPMNRFVSLLAEDSWAT
jgi:hypothetical protein